MTQIRTFIAVSIVPGPHLRPVIASLREMGSAVKPVAGDTLHITLKFLGDTPTDGVPEVLAIVEEIAAQQAAFELRLSGLGAFPRIERPSVVWVGVDGGEPLIEMAAEFETRLTGLGFPQEDRDFTPHLTLARIRRRPPDELFALLDQHTATSFGTMGMKAVTLYQSELRSRGPVYSALGSGKLKG